MNAAAAITQEMALRLGWLAQSKEITCAIHKLLLKLKASHPNEFGDRGQVVFAQIDVTLLVATVDTSPLALELQI